MNGVVVGMPLVRLERVGKKYRNDCVLTDITFELTAGSVTGLVGPNGAGKSTLLKIIAGFAFPSVGSGRVLGERVGAGCRLHPHVGWMSENPAFIDQMNGVENLELLASLRCQLPRRGVVKCMEMVGLDPAETKPVRSYSQGMRQRLSLAQAVMETPRLVLLDEPTNGLDPHGVVMLRQVVDRLSAGGSAVVFASHLLPEVEVVSDRIVFMDSGRITRTLERDALRRGDLEREYLRSVAEGRR